MEPNDSRNRPSYQRFLGFCTRLSLQSSMAMSDEDSSSDSEDAPMTTGGSPRNECGTPEPDTDPDSDTDTDSDPGEGFQVTGELSEIKKLLECPVCYEIALPPITLCVNGHSACSSCLGNLRSCPSCRDRLTQIRNRFAEEFLDKCRLRCRYHAGNGCQVKLPGRELADHLPVCDYRPLFCRDCRKMIPYHLFLEHLQDVELLESCPAPNAECRNGFQLGDETFAATKGFGFSLIWFQAHGHDFFCFLEIIHKSQWWIWVGCFGTPEESNKFNCVITVFNEENKMEKKYAGKVHPFRACPNEVLSSGCCLSASDASFRNFLREGGLDVIIKIINLEQQFPSDAEGSTSGEGESPMDVGGGIETVQPGDNGSCLRMNPAESSRDSDDDED